MRRAAPFVVACLLAAACSNGAAKSGTTPTNKPSAGATATIVVEGKGSVYANGVASPCSTRCSAPIASAGETLSAVGDKGWSLERWDGPCAPGSMTRASCTVEHGPATITAHFAADVSLTVNVTGGGAITSPALADPCRQACKLSGPKGSGVWLQPVGAAPSSLWSSCSVVSGTSCLAVLGDIQDVVADFKPRPEPPTETVVNGVPVRVRIDAGPGAVLADINTRFKGTFINCPRVNCMVSAPTGRMMAFVAAPNGQIFGDDEWMFSRWSGGCAAKDAPTSGATCELTIKGPTDVGASFVRKPKLIVRVVGDGTVKELFGEEPRPNLGPYSFGDTKPINCPSYCERRVDGVDDYTTFYVQANTGTARWEGCDWIGPDSQTCSVSRFLDANGQPVDRIVTVTFGNLPTIHFKGSYALENVWGADPQPVYRNEKVRVEWDVSVNATLQQLGGAPPMTGSISGHIRRIATVAGQDCEADLVPPPGATAIRPQGGNRNDGTAKFILSFPITREYLAGPDGPCGAPQNIASHPPPDYDVSKIEQAQITIDLNGDLIQTFPLDTHFEYMTTSAGRTVSSSALVTGFVTVSGLGRR